MTALYPEDEAPLLAAIREIKATEPEPTPHRTLAAAAADLAADH